MTTQEAYEAIRSHFTQFGAELARTTGGTCQYRTAAGQKCAVGVLIPDEAYSDRMEGNVLCTDWLARNPFMDGFLYGVDRGFLRSAQVLHDNVATDARAFVTGLDLLAKLYGLDVLGAVDTTLVKPLV